MISFGKTLTLQNQQLQQRVFMLERRLKIATTCLDKLSSGSFEMDIENLKQDVHDEESKTFVETLNRMNGKLIEYGQREKQRQWMAEGITTFIQLMSGDNSNRSDFYDRILAMLIPYIGANQGGIFILNDSNPQDQYLELVSCYAYSKKKMVEKRVEVGSGMLGQCFLEKETNIYTDIPQFYASITSGLGDSTPGFLILVPLKYNDDVLGVLELASFQNLPDYKIEFIEKIAENLASVSMNIHNAKHVNQLLEESKHKALLLQENEETLRQNVEELVATQEEMQRNQIELNRQTNLLKFILDNIPFPVFVKDEKGCYTVVNKAEARLFNLDSASLLGKDDSTFVNNHEEWEVIKESDERVLSLNEPVELPLQNFTTTKGSSYIFKTTKIPFVNEVTGKKNILGVSLDLTEKLMLEKKLFHEQRLSSNNILINITGRQRMLSQKIGFYAQSLARGQKQNAGILRDAIELHEHSLQVIRYGGMPMGVLCEHSLPPLPSELIFQMQEVEKIWEVYKNAAETLLYFSSLENHFNDSSKINDSEKNLQLIEHYAEPLLLANNHLIEAYLKMAQLKFIDVA